MTDEIQKDENVGEVPQAPLIIHKQYLKDFSFENPNAPEILMRADRRPTMEMNIQLDIQRHEHAEFENFYEVVLTLTSSAKFDGQTMFLAEISYGATASINGVPEKQHHPLLFIEVPQLIFPYARQILASNTQAGGFMPLQLAPVDFRAMYLQRFAEKPAEAQAEQA